MKTYRIWVERSDIIQEAFEIKAKTLEEAKDIAESGEVDPINPDGSLHIYGEVLDSWEDGCRGRS